MSPKQSVALLPEALLPQFSRRAVTMHDRIVPNMRGHVDHLVVAPSGVWIVAEPPSAGRVERRDVGRGGDYDPRLVVDGVDCTATVDDLAWQVHAVRAVIDGVGDEHLPVTPVLVFPVSQWPRFATSFEVKGVSVMRPKLLAELVDEAGPLDDRTIATLAAEFDRRFRPRT
jgi:hypothetical protein